MSWQGECQGVCVGCVWSGLFSAETQAPASSVGSLWVGGGGRRGASYQVPLVVYCLTTGLVSALYLLAAEGPCRSYVSCLC